MIESALRAIEIKGCALYFSLQNIAEFWNVCTRPADRSGFGLGIAEANRMVAAIEHKMTYLPDSDQVYLIWRRLVVAHNVRGVRVHDARLVTLMQAYGLTRLVTLNQSDFLRYPGLEAVYPRQLQESSL